MKTRFNEFITESSEDDRYEEWLGSVAGYLEVDYEIPTHDDILDTFMTIVDDELSELFGMGVSPSEAAGTVAANEKAMDELYSLMDEDEDDEEDWLFDEEE